jgi:(p)ppGpp synthase/HD superfamily hydrolase
MDIIEKAIQFATEKHEGQLDDEGLLAINHPIQTAILISLVAIDDHNLIAAAYLHDTLEDTNTTYDELVKEFGTDIADLVNEVTHEGTKDAHGYYFPRLATQRGIMLKFADRLSNLSRMNSWNKERKAQYLKRSRFWKHE